MERLLLALNISDLLTCIVAVPIKIALYIIIKDTENSPIQKFSYLVDLFCQFSSVLITTMVAVNNCIKITRFSSYDSLMTSRRVNNFIRATFIISASTISLPILFSPALVLIILILTIVTALIVMIISYVIIIKELKRTDEKLRKEATVEGKSRVKRENKVSKTILILLAFFSLCTILPDLWLVLDILALT